MDYEELIVNVQEIPRERAEIVGNIDLLLGHAEYLQDVEGITDPLARGLLDTVPSYIRKQLERLRLHIDDEADIIAWISRTLMELLFMLRYAYSGRDHYDELISEQLKDLRDIENIIYPEGEPPEDAPDEVKGFHLDMGRLWEGVRSYGVEREDLDRIKPALQFARGAEMEEDYRNWWKIHSKYVHPTSYLLFGKQSFVYAEDTRLCFLLLAQYYAAINLRDLHRMIEAIPDQGPPRSSVA